MNVLKSNCIQIMVKYRHFSSVLEKDTENAFKMFRPFGSSTDTESSREVGGMSARRFLSRSTKGRVGFERAFLLQAGVVSGAADTS